jgi:hypothetical protein
LRFRRALSRQLLHLAVGRVLGKLGMPAGTSTRAGGSPENDTGLGHRGCDDLRIVQFVGKALMEVVGLRTPGLQSCFHRWCRDGEIEEFERCLIGLQLARSLGFRLSLRTARDAIGQLYPRACCWLFPSCGLRVRNRIKQAPDAQAERHASPGVVRRQGSVDVAEFWHLRSDTGPRPAVSRANITSLPRFGGAFSWWRRNCACFNVLTRRAWFPP